MARKLLLVGFISVAGKGSYLQVFTALFISMGFIGLQLKLSPYRHHEDNLLKTTSSFQELFAIQVACMLRNAGDIGAAGELVDKGFYDSLAAYLFVPTILCPALLSVFVKVRRARVLCDLQSDAQEMSRQEKIQKAYAIHEIGFYDEDNEDTVAAYISSAIEEYEARMLTGGGVRAISLAKAAHVYVSFRSPANSRDAQGIVSALQTGGYITACSLPSTTPATLQAISDSVVVTSLLTAGTFDQSSCVVELHHAIENEVPIVLVRDAGWDYHKWLDVWANLAFAECTGKWIDTAEFARAKNAHQSLRLALTPLVGSTAAVITRVREFLESKYGSGILDADEMELSGTVEAVTEAVAKHGGKTQRSTAVPSKDEVVNLEVNRVDDIDFANPLSADYEDEDKEVDADAGSKKLNPLSSSQRKKEKKSGGGGVGGGGVGGVLGAPN